MIKEFLELDLALFEARGVDVGQVVGDNVEIHLLAFHASGSGIEGSKHRLWLIQSLRTVLRVREILQKMKVINIKVKATALADTSQIGDHSAHAIILHLHDLLIRLEHAHGGDQARHFSGGGSVGAFEKALTQL